MEKLLTKKQIKTTTNLKVDFSQVVYLQSDINYTELFFVNGKREIFAYTLKLFEAKLNESFIRIHRSYLVNKQFVEVINRQGLRLVSGDYLPVSRRRKDRF